jgi:dipeptidyl aminopeptidase/acylaminoacyl peptidase
MRGKPWPLLWGAALIVSLAPSLAAQSAGKGMAPRFTIEQVLSPAFAYDLVAARQVDRIAWLEHERGARNVYTAAAPDFRPVRLTETLSDDGVDLSGLQLSDDGSVAVFMRGHMPNREGWVANPTSDPAGAERSAWAVSTSGGRPWRVVEAQSVLLAPDGRSLLYLKEGQVYRAWVDPGAAGAERLEEAAPLFLVFGRVSNPVWSPDSRKIAFVSERGSHSFIGIYDLELRRITYLAPGVDRDLSPTWSADGERVAFIRLPGRTFGAGAARPAGFRAADHPPGLVDAAFSGGHALEVWVADAASGAGRRLWHPPAGDSAAAGLRRITWEGEHLLFQLEPGEWQRYYALSTARPEAGAVALTHEEGMPEQIATSPDGRFLYFATNHGDLDRRHIWRVPLGGGRPEQLTRGEEIETFPAVLASGDRIALLRAGARNPQAVALAPASGGEPRVLRAPPAEFPARAHVVPQNVILTAADGLQFHNQLFLPPDLRRGERRPALIFIHGGPRRQMLLGYNYGHFYHMAYAMNQYFANKGYVVLSVNYRAGIGYGKSFRDAPGRGREGNAEYQDILAAGLYLQGRPDVDPARVGLWGLSYGGILTAQGLARNSEVFAAGVDIAGVHSWGNPLEPESVAHRSSSISEIARWRSPVLLVHGDDDRNVAFSQTVGLVQLLRAHQVPFELIVFPDDVHSFLLHDRWLRTFHATDDFFERTLIRREPIRTEVAAAAAPGRP